MSAPRARPYLAICVGLFLVGCADRMVTLRYQPDSSIQPVSTARQLAIFKFADRRGTEGDEEDPFRVGGIYGGYGNRLAKVMVRSPWPKALTSALVTEFRAQGVDAIEASAPTPTDAYRLEGTVRNFSTESRWGREAHIGVTIRLSSPDNRVLVEKRIDVRESGYALNNFNADILEELLNRAFAKFVHDVAADAEIRGALR